jgi:hypothetical protein
MKTGDVIGLLISYDDNKVHLFMNEEHSGTLNYFPSEELFPFVGMVIFGKLVDL